MRWSVGTPTEWGARNPDGIYAETGERVAQVYGLPQNCFLGEVDAEKYAEPLANARLIAAAPELLEALRDVLTWADPYAVPGMDRNVESVERANDAIAKATGRSE